MALPSSIRPDIQYYMGGYPVLFGRISGIIWPDMISESGSKKLQDIRLSGFGSISRVSGYPAKSLSGTSLNYCMRPSILPSYDVYS